MNRLHTLDYALGQLRQVVGTLDDSVMDGPTNCAPWSVRRLASHALNNQLVWAGLVTGQQLVARADAMAAVPIPGDLEPVAADVTGRVMALWRREGVLDATHETPFGALPGTVVIDFAIIDAAAHAWDLSASLGQPVEFDPSEIPVLAEVVDVTCTDAAREHDLIKAATQPPVDATDTERLMAAAGRTIPR
ncbi:MAG: TIGR03086 family metal-binding protein [Actinomycetes bacterium]